MEEEAFGEEEEVLREMEMGAEGTGVKSHHGVSMERQRVEVGDSQVPAELGRNLPGKTETQGGDREPAGLLSGFDEEALYDSLDEGKQRQQDQQLRQFKKRGQKRTTRLVNMRPTRARRPAQTGGDPDEEEDEEGDMVPETQFTASSTKASTTTRANADDLRLSDIDSASEMDFDASESDDEQEEKHVKTKAAKSKPKKPAATTKTKTDKDSKTGDEAKGEAKGEGVVKRAVRKVKATAHANFKRLKLRNSGAKGGPAHNSRFRRRR
jgi:hypothetical protein